MMYPLMRKKMTTPNRPPFSKVWNGMAIQSDHAVCSADVPWVRYNQKPLKCAQTTINDATPRRMWMNAM